MPQTLWARIKTRLVATLLNAEEQQKRVRVIFTAKVAEETKYKKIENILPKILSKNIIVCHQEKILSENVIVCHQEKILSKNVILCHQEKAKQSALQQPYQQNGENHFRIRPTRG